MVKKFGVRDFLRADHADPHFIEYTALLMIGFRAIFAESNAGYCDAETGSARGLADQLRGGM